MDKNDEPSGKMMSDMTHEQRVELALAIADEKVFGSWSIKDPSMVGSVFMPLAFIEEPLPKNAAHVYEYLNEAMPRSINGMPIFGSCRMITEDDWNAVAMLTLNVIQRREQERQELLGGEKPQ